MSTFLYYTNSLTSIENLNVYFNLIRDLRTGKDNSIGSHSAAPEIQAPSESLADIENSRHITAQCNYDYLLIFSSWIFSIQSHIFFNDLQKLLF